MDVFVRDRQNGTTERVSVASDGTQADGSAYTTSISGDGRYVTFTQELTIWFQVICTKPIFMCMTVKVEQQNVYLWLQMVTRPTLALGKEYQ